MFDPTTMPLVPKISEKAVDANVGDQYVFIVPMDANKSMIIKAVETQFDDVKVKDVRTLVVKGKSKKSMRRRLQPLDGRRKDTKKAYVSLSKGKITLLEQA